MRIGRSDPCRSPMRITLRPYHPVKACHSERSEESVSSAPTEGTDSLMPHHGVGRHSAHVAHAKRANSAPFRMTDQYTLTPTIAANIVAFPQILLSFPIKSIMSSHLKQFAQRL